MCGDNISDTIYVICVSSKTISVFQNKKQLERENAIEIKVGKYTTNTTNVMILSRSI